MPFTVGPFGTIDRERFDIVSSSNKFYSQSFPIIVLDSLFTGVT